MSPYDDDDDLNIRGRRGHPSSVRTFQYSDFVDTPPPPLFEKRSRVEERPRYFHAEDEFGIRAGRVRRSSPSPPRRSLHDSDLKYTRPRTQHDEGSTYYQSQHELDNQENHLGRQTSLSSGQVSPIEPLKQPRFRSHPHVQYDEIDDFDRPRRPPSLDTIIRRPYASYQYTEDSYPSRISSGAPYIPSPIPPLRQYSATRNYEPPTNDYGNSLKFDVNPTALAGDNREIEHDRASNSLKEQKMEAMCIETSRGYTDDNGEDTIVLTLDLKGTANKAAGHLRWIHMQHEHMSLNSLQHVIARTADLSSEDVLIALRVLRRAREKAEKESIHGYYLEPMVVRCDSRDTGDRKKPDRNCTFVNFPYFSLQTTPSSAKHEGTHLHSARGLLQTLYCLESAETRELDQVIRKIQNSKVQTSTEEKIIIVPQIWSIVLGSDMIITYSSSPLSTLLGGTISIPPSISTIRTGPSVIRVIDPFERLFFFSLDQCRTWFELTYFIEEQCLATYGFVLDKCQIFLTGGKLVTGTTWSTLLGAEKSTFVNLFVKFKENDMRDEEGGGGDLINGSDSSEHTSHRHTPYFQGSRTDLHLRYNGRSAEERTTPRRGESSNWRISSERYLERRSSESYYDEKPAYSGQQRSRLDVHQPDSLPTSRTINANNNYARSVAEERAFRKEMSLSPVTSPPPPRPMSRLGIRIDDRENKRPSNSPSPPSTPRPETVIPQTTSNAIHNSNSLIEVTSSLGYEETSNHSQEGLSEIIEEEERSTSSPSLLHIHETNFGNFERPSSSAIVERVRSTYIESDSERSPPATPTSGARTTDENKMTVEENSRAQSTSSPLTERNRTREVEWELEENGPSLTPAKPSSEETEEVEISPEESREESLFSIQASEDSVEGQRMREPVTTRAKNVHEGVLRQSYSLHRQREERDKYKETDMESELLTVIRYQTRPRMRPILNLSDSARRPMENRSIRAPWQRSSQENVYASQRERRTTSTIHQRSFREAPYHSASARRTLPPPRRGSSQDDDYIAVHERRFLPPLRLRSVQDHRDENVVPVQKSSIGGREYRQSSRHFITRHEINSPSKPLAQLSAHIIRRYRGRPSSNGVVVNEDSEDDEKRDIYYIPEKDRPKQVPAENVIETNETSMTNGEAQGQSFDHGSSRVENSIQDAGSTKSSRNNPRSRSSTHVRPTVKSSVLPFLMWPTSATDVTHGVKNVNAEDGGFPQNMAEPSSGTSDPHADNNQPQVSDTSLSEILERIQDLLIAEVNFDHHILFRKMEMAKLEDAVFKASVKRDPTGNSKDSEGTPNQNLKSSSKSAGPSTAGASNLNPDPEFLPSNDEKTPKRLEYEIKLREFSEAAQELLETFVPVNYSSIVTRRYCGAMRKIINLISESHIGKEALDANKNKNFIWITHDRNDTSESLEKHKLEPPRVPLSSCAKCKSRTSYSSKEEAANHLRTIHFQTKQAAYEIVDSPPLSELNPWIKSFHRSWNTVRCEEHMRVLRTCCDHLNVMIKYCRQIQDGVLTNDSTHPSRYRLPTAFVDSFRRLVIFLVYTCHVLELINKNSKNWSRRSWDREDNQAFIDAFRHLVFIGSGAEADLEQGKLDLMSMIKTHDYTQDVRYEAIGPQYILAMVMNNLQLGVGCTDLLDIYKKYTARLAFQVSQRPKKRLLRDFKYLEEEIGIIRSTLDQQLEILEDYARVLDPISFRITSQTRISMYFFEDQLIAKTQNTINKRMNEFDQLQEQTDRLIQQAKMSVQILDDDHGKAILVLTVVTLVFLPLIFITNFFEMNTVDIRNQNSSQSIFWAVAVPVTGLVIVLALLFRYRYDEMRRLFDSWAKKVFKA